MSSASPTRADRLRKSVGVDVQTLQATVAAPIRFVGFWAAVLLPFAYTPLLFTELQGSMMTAFLALITLHIASLVLGRQYRR